MPKKAKKKQRRQKPPAHPPGWVPYKVLDAFLHGQCTQAIQEVGLSDKPLAEIGICSSRLEDLELDLQRVLDESHGREYGVRFYVQPSRPREYTYGFYKEEWVMRALHFLAKKNISQFDRAWISGRLFGYSNSAIQHYIIKKGFKPPKRTKSKRAQRATGR